jgi:hypothetical protein
MKETLEYKILKYLSENDNGEYIDVSNLHTDKNLLRSKLNGLSKEKLITCNLGIDIRFGDGNNIKVDQIKAKIEFKGIEYLNKFETENKSINNNFNNSTIGQLNQSDELSVLKTEIKQTIQPATKEKQQNAIISLVEKFWWQILIPLVLGIALLAIQQKWFT